MLLSGWRPLGGDQGVDGRIILEKIFEISVMRMEIGWSKLSFGSNVGLL
jgi:hypothetical protein